MLSLEPYQDYSSSARYSESSGDQGQLRQSPNRLSRYDVHNCDFYGDQRDYITFIKYQISKEMLTHI